MTWLTTAAHRRRHRRNRRHDLRSVLAPVTGAPGLQDITTLDAEDDRDAVTYPTRQPIRDSDSDTPRQTTATLRILGHPGETAVTTP
jgi:hypothetical protein